MSARIANSSRIAVDHNRATLKMLVEDSIPQETCTFSILRSHFEETYHSRIPMQSVAHQIPLIHIREKPMSHISQCISHTNSKQIQTPVPYPMTKSHYISICQTCQL